MAIAKGKKSNREIVYGINAVQSALQISPDKITAAWIVKGREDKRISNLEARLLQQGIKVQNAMRHFLDEKTDNGVHQGIVIELLSSPPLDERFLSELFAKYQDGQPQLFLILDGVTDPHNLGAAMRSAWAAGADALIVPKDKSASFSPVARKAASGAAGVLPLVVVTNLSRTIDFLKEHNVEVIGLDGGAQSNLYQYDFPRQVALVMGSEESGMRHLTTQKCDALVKIPMAAGVESLNVSVAAGVALFEVVRQRQ